MREETDARVAAIAAEAHEREQPEGGSPGGGGNLGGAYIWRRVLLSCRFAYVAVAKRCVCCRVTFSSFPTKVIITT